MARLQTHHDVARVLSRREQTELGSGAPRIGRHFRRRREDLFDRANLAIGLSQSAAGGRQVIENESTFIRCGKEPGAHPGDLRFLALGPTHRGSVASQRVEQTWENRTE